MHIVHGPNGGTSVPKAVGHCVRMRTRPVGAKITVEWIFLLVTFLFITVRLFFACNSVCKLFLKTLESKSNLVQLFPLRLSNRFLKTVDS